MKPEAQVLIHIKSYLQYRNIYYHRINTGLMKTANDQFYRTAEKGTPDILCCYKGRFVAIEAKSPIGKQSEHQKRDEQWLKDNGGEYWIIRDVDVLKQNFEKLDTEIQNNAGIA